MESSSSRGTTYSACCFTYFTATTTTRGCVTWRVNLKFHQVIHRITRAVSQSPGRYEAGREGELIEGSFLLLSVPLDRWMGEVIGRVHFYKLPYS